MHDVQKEEDKEIEDVFIVSTPSKYVAARRDAPKIEKIIKFSLENNKDKYIMKGIQYRKNIIF